MWTDIHAHLFNLSGEELRGCVEKYLFSGVTTVVNNAVSIATAQIVIEQSKKFQSLVAAVGISPFDVTSQPPDWFDKLKKLASHKECRAIGEIGIDNTNPRYPLLDQQLPFFKKQLELAVQMDIPAIIHSRGAEMHAAQICKQRGVQKAIFHCFTGDLQALRFITQCGYCISISGIVTYKNSHLTTLLPEIPLENLFIETDSPYLSPVPKRGKPNSPSYLPYTGLFLCDILKVTPPELQSIVKGNFNRLFL